MSRPLPADYIAYLNGLVDDVYKEAAKTWDWETTRELNQWADKARLHPMTIWKLAIRETKIPQLLTIWKLAKSVGWSLEMKKGRRPRLRKAA